MIPSRVTLVEVGPRDGLQNEKEPVATEHKVALVQRLQAAGLREIEVTSFVSPKWVPQMADNAQVMAGIQRQPGVRYSVLTPNMKGLEAALPSKPDEIVVFGAATEAFSQRNINCSIAESIERFAPVVAAARAAGIKVRGAVSCALGCPYQGEVSADEVEHVVRLLKEIGVQHVGIADTIGVGTPRKAQAVLERALKHYPLDRGERPFPRHLWPGAVQHLCLHGDRRAHLRRQRRRPRRLPVCQGRHRQRGHRRRGVHARRPRRRDRHRSRRAGRCRRVHLRAARPPAGVARGARAAGQARQGVRA